MSVPDSFSRTSKETRPSGCFVATTNSLSASSWHPRSVVLFLWASPEGTKVHTASNKVVTGNLKETPPERSFSLPASLAGSEVAAAYVQVELDPEPGCVGQANAPLLEQRDVAPGERPDPGRLDEVILEAEKATARRGDMRGGDGSESAAVAVDGHGEVLELGVVCDPPCFVQAAGEHHVGMNDVARPVVDENPELLGGEHFTHAD